MYALFNKFTSCKLGQDILINYVIIVDTKSSSIASYFPFFTVAWEIGCTEDVNLQHQVLDKARIYTQRLRISSQQDQNVA